jgi:cytochrome c5
MEVRVRVRALAVLLILAVGCASASGNGPVKASGDSSARSQTGDIVTKTTNFNDGTVEVVETCKNCHVIQAKGGPGSGKFYEAVFQVIAAVLSVGAIVVTALK